MEDNKEFMEGAEKAPVIQNNKIEEFEEKADYGEMAKLEREVNKILEPIGAEVKEKIKEMEEKKLQEFIKEQDDLMAEAKEHNAILDILERKLPIDPKEIELELQIEQIEKQEAMRATLEAEKSMTEETAQKDGGDTENQELSPVNENSEK